MMPAYDFDFDLIHVVPFFQVLCRPCICPRACRLADLERVRLPYLGYFAFRQHEGDKAYRVHAVALFCRYAAQRRKLINMSHAAQVVDAGTPNDHSKKSTGDTIYLTTVCPCSCISFFRGVAASMVRVLVLNHRLWLKNIFVAQADSSGMMVSLIQSNYEGFGSGLVAPGTGFALQDRGALFSMDPAAADVYAAGKRPFHTIIPGFVFKDERPWLSFGVMGGNMQPQGHAQILSNIIDFGMNVQEAGDAAR